MGGAALLIVFHALIDLLGITEPTSHGLPALVGHLATQLPAVSPGALAVGLSTVTVALTFKRWLPRWPYLLVALVCGTLAASLLNPWLLQTGSGLGLRPVTVVGAIPPIWPTLHWPQVEWRSLPDLIGISFALTIVALGQSISIAKAVAERSGQQISTNREFVGQGLSNVVGGFFQCYVSCGSLNRSMPNFEAGAKTPLAAVFSSLLLLALIAVSAQLLALIPRAGIAGLLLLIAWSLLDLPGWRRLWRASRSDFAIAAATGLATISIRIEMAILLGTILSLVAYLHRTSKPAMRTMVFDTVAADRSMVVRADAQAPLPECPQLKMLRMEGEVYFGAVTFVGDQLRDLRLSPGAQGHLLVMAKSMNFIDLAAADMWRQELLARRAMGGDLYFHRPRPQVLQLWARLGFVQELGADHIFPSKRAAIANIFPRLDPAVCARCTVRLYEECRSLPPPQTDQA
jgi:sulfate permease, SulP family